MKILIMLATLTLAGCSVFSPKTERYPFGQMIDPVTEQTPTPIGLK